MDEDEELKSEDAKVLLRRIARELTTIRRLASQGVNQMVKAESEIPEYMRRFLDYMHDVHDIKYMYEDLGHQAPEHLRREAERCDDRFRQLWERLHAEGEVFNKIRREMAEDPNNRWDHKRLLFPPKANGDSDETRKSNE